jgi:hypothetical protein
MIADLLGFLVYGVLLFFAGAFWRDRKSARVERDLKARIEAQRLVIRSWDIDRAFLRALKLDPAIAGIEQDREHYNRLKAECFDGTIEERFNKGVIHGLNAALLRIRGWI